MPNFDILKRRIKCHLMIAAQKEQKTLRVENSHESEQLAESSYVKLTIGILQSIVEKMEASQPTQKVISLYFK